MAEALSGKRPAFQFYPGDWRKEVGLRTCSLAARGLWIEMLTIMHDCEPYGRLCIAGAPIDASQLARMVGEDFKIVKKCLAELEAGAVFSRDESGRIFSRRMVRDEEKRAAAADLGREYGQRGVEHGAKGAGFGKLGGRPRKENTGGKITPPTGGKITPPTGGSKPPHNPPSSTSSSSSSSSAEKDAGTPAGAGALDKPTRQKPNGGVDAVVPDWVPAEPWADFVAMRRASPKPFTLGAAKLVLAELTKLKDAGYPPGDVLNQSVRNSWLDVFKIRDQSNGKANGSGGNGIPPERPGNVRTQAVVDLVGQFGTAAQARH